MEDFRKLADVESVEEPADGTNVLIEENGVIKKAPKTAVGGSGKVFLNVPEDCIVNNWKETGHNGYDLTGILSYEEAKNAILTGGLVLIASVENTPMGAMIAVVEFNPCRMLEQCKAITDGDLLFMFFAESDADSIKSMMG